MGARLRLSIDSDLDAARMLGVAVQSLCRYWEFSELQAYQIELCVMEAVTNVIRHAYGGRPGHPVELSVSLDQNLRFEIRDQGAAMPAGCLEESRQLPASETLEILPEGGRGLFLLQTIMDHVSYESTPEGNTLILTCGLARATTRSTVEAPP